MAATAGLGRQADAGVPSSRLLRDDVAVGVDDLADGAGLAEVRASEELRRETGKGRRARDARLVAAGDSDAGFARVPEALTNRPALAWARARGRGTAARRADCRHRQLEGAALGDVARGRSLLGERVVDLAAQLRSHDEPGGGRDDDDRRRDGERREQRDPAPEAHFASRSA